MNLLKEYTRNKDFYGFKRLQRQLLQQTIIRLINQTKR